MNLYWKSRNLERGILVIAFTLCLLNWCINCVECFLLVFPIYSIAIGFQIQVLRSAQFCHLAIKEVHNFQGQASYHQMMHFFQNLKPKLFPRSMAFLRWSCYLCLLCIHCNKKSNLSICVQINILCLMYGVYLMMAFHGWQFDCYGFLSGCCLCYDGHYQQNSRG